MVDVGSPLRHHHVFGEFVAPFVRTAERRNWNNLSPDKVGDGGDIHSAEDCRRRCEETWTCVQWLFVADGTCRTSEAVRLGEAVEETDGEGVWMTSGWVEERVDRMVRRWSGCRRGEWINGD